MNEFLSLPVPEDYYVTNKFREFAQETLNNGGPSGDSPLVELLAQAVFNLETDYRNKLAELEARIRDAGVPLAPRTPDE